MKTRQIAIAFDMDDTSLAALRDGLPGWQVLSVSQADPTAVPDGGGRARADLVVIGTGRGAEHALALCRLLGDRPPPSDRPAATGKARGRRGPREIGAGRPGPSLLLLVGDGQESLVGRALRAGADNCLVLPLNAKQLANMWAHAHDGNQPGRHTLNLDRAQRTDPWRDDGGQG